MRRTVHRSSTLARSAERFNLLIWYTLKNESILTSAETGQKEYLYFFSGSTFDLVLPVPPPSRLILAGNISMSLGPRDLRVLVVHAPLRSLGKVQKKFYAGRIFTSASLGHFWFLKWTSCYELQRRDSLLSLFACQLIRSSTSIVQFFSALFFLTVVFSASSCVWSLGPELS